MKWSEFSENPDIAFEWYRVFGDITTAFKWFKYIKDVSVASFLSQYFKEPEEFFDLVNKKTKIEEGISFEEFCKKYKSDEKMGINEKYRFIFPNTHNIEAIYKEKVYDLYNYLDFYHSVKGKILVFINPLKNQEDKKLTKEFIQKFIE